MDDNDMETQFIAAYDAYADAIFRHCFFRVSDREKAKDLMQETFMHAWSSLTRGTQIQNLRAFLYRTAHNLVIDEYRKKKTISLDTMAEEGFDPSENPTDRTHAELDVRLILTHLKDLKAEYRDVLVMRYLDGMSPGEIAEVFGVTENVVSVRLHRAKQYVHQHYGNS